jgi:hypothetical protein
VRAAHTPPARPNAPHRIIPGAQLARFPLLVYSLICKRSWKRLGSSVFKQRVNFKRLPLLLSSSTITFLRQPCLGAPLVCSSRLTVSALLPAATNRAGRRRKNGRKKSRKADSLLDAPQCPTFLSAQISCCDSSPDLLFLPGAASSLHSFPLRRLLGEPSPPPRYCSSPILARRVLPWPRGFLVRGWGISRAPRIPLSCLLRFLRCHN